MKNGGEPQESQEDDTNISLLSPHIMTNTLMLFSPNQKSANIIGMYKNNLLHSHILGIFLLLKNV